MKAVGCKMIFLGAETGNNETFKQLNTGGTQTGQGLKDFASHLYPTGIIPEFYFVLGMPAYRLEQVMAQIKWDINFIKEIKKINPDSEIIIYPLYYPKSRENMKQRVWFFELYFKYLISLVSKLTQNKIKPF
jgi:anaerobic magnesium-protoporphyrin IX monomethyl ester cyclase